MKRAADGWIGRLIDRFRPDTGLTRPPKVMWALPDAPGVIGLGCPNCGDDSPKPLLLSVDFTPPRRARQHWRVVRCPGCTCCFYERQTVADYGDDEMLTRGRAALYLQQGAGLAQLIDPIARLGLPAGTRYLDIGCGFGFGLDFARRSLGWDAHGIDPAQIAGLGQRLLGLPIEQRLLGADEPLFHGACDVVMAAETIEHVPDPAAFLAILKATLAPGGVLVLTTPDACALRPETPPGQLVGLLSPELHLVLQSEASLRLLLERAGFTAIEIGRDGGGLVAHASLAAIPGSRDSGGAAYRAYLEGRAADCADPDLFWGFAGRGLLGAVNAGDWAAAARLRATLAVACRARFGIDLDAPVLPAETEVCSLERMAALMPFNLASICYGCAMLALAQGAARPSQEGVLLVAAEAARRLRRAVGDLAMEDALSEDLGWAAEAEAMLCAAAAAPPGIVDRIVSLSAAPGGNEARREAVQARAFCALVHAGRYAEARLVAASCPWAGEGAAEAVFCRAILDLQPGGDAAAAQAGFARVRGLIGPSDLYWAALRAELQALGSLGRRDTAEALRRGIIAGVRLDGGAVPDDLGSLIPEA